MKKTPDIFDIAVIGAGAAGCFAAIQAAEANRNLNIAIFEKTGKSLSKVRISGGGRCNVTQNGKQGTEFSRQYPRGASLMKKLLQVWSNKKSMDWFINAGVDLKTEKDGRVFPVSNNSEDIVNCLLDKLEEYNIPIYFNQKLENLEFENDYIRLVFEDKSELTRKVILCSGGFPKTEQYKFLNNSNHKITEPIPSLFTFNIKDKKLHNLMGIAAPNASVKISGSKDWHQGPILITHWGLSGPAVLKASAVEAIKLHELNYNAKILVNWCSKSEEELQHWFQEGITNHGKTRIYNYKPQEIPSGLFQYLIQKSNIDDQKPLCEITRQEKNKLVETLCRDEFMVSGKTTFKEEFVTAGGINLNEIETNSMESKFHPGLYFAGELLNIDGLTGGYNFQAAWSTAYIAGKSAAAKKIT